jgi:predicted Zn-dependent protease
MKYRTILKWTTLSLVAAVLLAGMSYGGYRWYKKTKTKRMVASARTCFAKGDYKGAGLFLRQVFDAEPENLEATKIMADLTQQLETPNSIVWRRKVAELEPHVLQHYLSWARLAILHNQYLAAEEALKAVPETNRNSAVFHHVSSGVFLGLGKPRDAETHAAEALKLDPENELYQFDLAAIRLKLGDSNLAEQARISIGKLTQDPRFGCEAMHALVRDAVAHKQSARAMALSTELQSKPCVKFRDRLEHLEILKKAQSPEVDAFLARLLPEAEKSAGDVFQLTAWMLQNDRAEAASQWLLRLPPQIKGKQPVRSAIADTYVARKEWTNLESFLANQNWGDLDPLRLALVSRALKEQGDKRKSRTTWNTAVHRASPQAETLMLLLRASESWGWSEETEDVLWRLKERPKYVGWSLKNLYARYEERGDTRSLHKVVSELIRLNPADDGAKNNFCVFSLLLDIHTDKAADYARELYQKYPTNSTVVTTYAFALHKQKKNKQAMEILKILSPEQLKEPSVAAYYGIILAESGNAAQADHYLKLAQTARLLPEERALLAKVSQ